MLLIKYINPGYIKHVLFVIKINKYNKQITKLKII